MASQIALTIIEPVFTNIIKSPFYYTLYYNLSTVSIGLISSIPLVYEMPVLCTSKCFQKLS